MTEKISSEINDGITKGARCITQATGNALNEVKSIGVSIWGETTVEWSDYGKWNERAVRPGVRHLFKLRKSSFIH